MVSRTAENEEEPSASQPTRGARLRGIARSVACASRRHWAVSLVVVLGLLLGLHAWYYWPFLSDDALISLRYGQRLAEGHGLTWTGNERVEGYTDLLWVLLAAVAHLFRLDLIGAARTIDFLGAFAAIAFVCLSARENRISTARVASGGLALAAAAPLAVWAIGGLEHGFMTGLIAAAIVLLRRAWESEVPRTRTLAIAGGLLAAIALSRADGMVLVACAAAGLVLSRLPTRRSLRALLIVFAIPAAVLAMQLLFRVFYYGEWVPNTALVKVSFNMHRLVQGLHHVRDGYTPLLPMLALVIGALAVQIRHVPVVRWALPLVMAIGWSAYLAVVGGDIFPGWRQLLLAIIPLATILADGAEALSERWPRLRWLVPAACLPALGAGLWLQTKNPENIRADEEMWEWDGRAIGPMLRIAFGDKEPLLAVDAAGALPYWSRLPSLDMLGLNDKYIATHPPKHFGTKSIGHELGDGAYVLKRKPDIIAFNNAGGAEHPHFLSGREMVRTPEFKRNYQKVLLRGHWGHRPYAWLWIRREDGLLGLRRSPDRIDLPGYFFAGLEAYAVLDQKQLVTEVTPTQLGKLPGLKVPRGTWLLEFDPPVPSVDVGFRCDEKNSIPSSAGGPPIIRVDDGRTIDIVVGTRSGTHLIRSAALVRTNQPANFTCPPRRGPPTVELPAVSRIQEERGNWAYPTHFVLDERGVTIRLREPSSAAAVHMSADNNDVMELYFQLGEQVVGRERVRPKPNVAGMAFQRVEVPAEARQSTFDSIRVVPMQGDQRYALGHLVLLAQ